MSLLRSPHALVVATTSRYRLALLDQLGVPYQAVPHRVDEEPYKGRGLAPRELASVLARDKAESVAADHPEAFVLGSDQVCFAGDDVLSKPVTAARAREQLERLAGRAHGLVTSVALRYPNGEIVERRVEHSLHVRALDAGAIARYVEADAPLDCAGSYRLESRGIALFERIEAVGGGDNYTSIVGLPLITLTGMLMDAGFDVL